MTDNTRHEPGSTRSWGPAFSPKATPGRRFLGPLEKCDHYAYKMRPNSETQILIGLLSDTYNFTMLKCTHFLPGLNLDLNRCHNLNRPGSLFAFPRSGSPCFPCHAVASSRPCLLSVPYGNPLWQNHIQYCTKSNKTERFPIFPNSDHVIPTTYDDTLSSRSIFQEVLDDL
jgi:hypothetical protein